MKKFILILSILFCMGSTATKAQVSFSINIGSQPIWGPTGYDYVEYYYIPDIDAYYDVNTDTYIYLSRGSWIHSHYLPSHYRNVDLYRIHKVVINEPRPWLHHQKHWSLYRSYRGRHDQLPIRDSRDHRYYANPHHPHHNEWHPGRNRGYNNNHHYQRSSHTEHHSYNRGHGNNHGHNRDRGHGNGRGHGHHH